jgi:Zn-dependent protease with chaperone function
MIGSGIFFDGRTNARQPVAVALGPDAVEISTPAAGLLASWRFAEIVASARREGILRIGQAHSKVPARLEIHDVAFASELMGRARASDRSGLTDRRTRTKVVLWSIAAVASLVGCAIWGVPYFADRVAPHLPLAVETRLGDAVDAQIRRVLDTGKDGKPFVCGITPESEASRAALARLVATLEGAAALPLPLRVTVVRRVEANAVALPGGRIYLFEGLLAKANTVDEVAGVLGHEIGHVAHRDGTKSVLRAGGLGLLFGMVLGDFSGGGAIVLAAKVVLQSSTSRETEAAADDFGARLIASVGGDPRALGAFLMRLSGNGGGIPHFLLSHPEGKERADAIDRIERAAVTKPLLTPSEWAALKKICS